MEQDIQALAERATAFRQTLRRVKQRIGDPGFEWYRYDTLSSLYHIDKLLTGESRFLLDRVKGRILDLGCGDGEMSFLLENLGYHVVAVDHPRYNHNGMRGVRRLKAALGSSVEVHEIDVDRTFALPHDTYDLVLFLGVLYHLRNPFFVLEELARRAAHCLLSTRVARQFPSGAPMPPDAPAAYLVREDELNRDNTNYFIFSETGLRVMLHRAHWDVRDYISVGDTVHSDPVRPDRDERAFCLVRSRYNGLAHLELLDGWHESEETGWRWTRREFAVRIRSCGTALTMKTFFPKESLQRLGALTLSVSVNGRDLVPAVFETAGHQTLVRQLGHEPDNELLLRFRLSDALPPDESDQRERGIVVGSIVVD